MTSPTETGGIVERIEAVIARHKDCGCAVLVEQADLRALLAFIEQQAATIAELEQQRLMVLATLYAEAPRLVATICDEKLDRSGKLLGEVRELARATLAKAARP